ncbi:MAG: HAD family hydrolase, partial [Anaerolineales bacterium]
SMSLQMIAFDADDTLWHNEIYYRQGRQLFDEIMAEYGLESDSLDLVDQIELENLQFYGYGAVGFAISLVEASIELTDGRIKAADILRLLSISKRIVGAEVELFEGVEDVLRSLAGSHRLILITKGDLRHQRQKVDESGLESYFDGIEIVSEKDESIYQEIVDRWRVPPDQFLMVGNSMRSDVLPVLQIGGMAAHLTNTMTWDYEQAPTSNLPTNRFFQLERLEEAIRLVERLDDR